MNGVFRLMKNLIHSIAAVTVVRHLANQLLIVCRSEMVHKLCVAHALGKRHIKVRSATSNSLSSVMSTRTDRSGTKATKHIAYLLTVLATKPKA